MWKCVARGFRESLERRTNCRTNVYTQSSQDSDAKEEVKSSLVSKQKLLAPTFLNKKGFGSTKDQGARDDQRNSHWNARPRWSEAVGLTGVVTLGWVVCQSLCLRKKMYKRDRGEYQSVPQPKVHPELRFSRLLDQVKNIQPRQVLPKTYCDSSKDEPGDESIFSIQDCSGSSDFGPVTIEEALSRAKAEFEQQHKIALAEYELRYGIQAIEEHRYKDAMRHFIKGANLSSSKSMFNLGVCYEKGLGTLDDSVKAASYYKKAADLGHPDALYNLAVYHAQGRGGLSIDRNMARSLFEKAAKMGHSGAQRALELDNKFNAGSNSHPKQKIDSSQFERIIKYEDETTKEPESFSNSYAMKTPTDVFLEFLGVHNKNVIPLSLSLGK